MHGDQGHFLSGEDLSSEIRQILREPGAKAAVAFWGRGSDSWVAAGDARVICNLSSGGTNPHAIKLLGRRARQIDELHAKVYVGSARAVITSANASANGLGLEAGELAHWIEAGYQTSDIGSASEWFERRWTEARPITEGDLDVAKQAWEARQKARPAFRSFAGFDPDSYDLPLVSWTDPSNEYDLADEAFMGLEGSALADYRRRADEGLEIGHSKDFAVMRGRWILFCYRTRSGKASRQTKPWFVQGGETILPKSFSYTGETKKRDLLLAPEVVGKPPFDPGERRFVEAFRLAINDPSSAGLLDLDDGTSPWYASRVEDARSFWRLVHQIYLQQAI